MNYSPINFFNPQESWTHEPLLTRSFGSRSYVSYRPLQVQIAMGENHVSPEQLFLKKNMRLMVDQLMYKKRHGKVVIIMSKKGGTGDRGDLLLRRGKTISGHHFVVDIIFHMGTYVFKAYRRDTSQILVVRLTKEKLWRWFNYSETCIDTPPLLRLENRKKLLLWFLDRIFVCEGELFSYQLS